MTAEQTKDIMAFIDWNPHSPKAMTFAQQADHEILRNITLASVWLQSNPITGAFTARLGAILCPRQIGCADGEFIPRSQEKERQFLQSLSPAQELPFLL